MIIKFLNFNKSVDRIVFISCIFFRSYVFFYNILKTSVEEIVSDFIICIVIFITFD